MLKDARNATLFDAAGRGAAAGAGRPQEAGVAAGSELRHAPAGRRAPPWPVRRAPPHPAGGRAPLRPGELRRAAHLRRALNVAWLRRQSDVRKTNGSGKCQRNMIFRCYIAIDDSFDGT
jgi:hypothetical protein